MKNQQGRTTITVATEAHELLRRLADENGWSVAVAAQTAFEALAVLMDRHKKTAKKARQKDLRELFLKVAYAMPGGLMGAEVAHGRFPDGRAALVVTLLGDEKKPPWIIGEDNNGDLMAVRQDGSQVGGIVAGDIAVLAERQRPEVEALESLMTS
jgi:hypothetical protein